MNFDNCCQTTESINQNKKKEIKRKKSSFLNFFLLQSIICMLIFKIICNCDKFELIELIKVLFSLSLFLLSCFHKQNQRLSISFEKRLSQMKANQFAINNCFDCNQWWQFRISWSNNLIFHSKEFNFQFSFLFLDCVCCSKEQFAFHFSIKLRKKTKTDPIKLKNNVNQFLIRATSEISRSYFKRKRKKI